MRVWVGGMREGEGREFLPLFSILSPRYPAYPPLPTFRARQGVAPDGGREEKGVFPTKILHRTTHKIPHVCVRARVSQPVFGSGTYSTYVRTNVSMLINLFISTFR